MPEEQEIQGLDTQEPTVEESEELTEDEEEVEESEESDEEEPLELGLDEDEEEEGDNADQPLADLRNLITQDPARALERVAQVEQGLLKLQTQKAEAEQFRDSIDTVFKGLEAGNTDAIAQFEQVLYDNTGLTYQSLATLSEGGSITPQKPAESPKLELLERKLNALEQERASSKWIQETGKTVADRVARVTGLEFAPELIWDAKSLLKKGSTEEDVRKAIMRTNPDAYDKAVALRDGDKSPTPRAATLPTGRGGVQKVFSHDHNGFLKAYAAKQARGG